MAVTPEGKQQELFKQIDEWFAFEGSEFNSIIVLREEVKSLAKVIVLHVPNDEDREMALSKLRESLFYAEWAINKMVAKERFRARLVQDDPPHEPQQQDDE